MQEQLSDLGQMYQQKVLKWRQTPATFVTDIWGITPDPWQCDALQALADHGRVSIRACHGPGKTALDAWAINWMMACYFPTRIPCTAPSGGQLEDILWPELSKWQQAAPKWFAELFRLTSQRYMWAAAEKESFAVARTASKDKPDAMQGFHCDHVLYIADEAPGVYEEIYQVAMGALTKPNAKVLLTGNPTRTQGFFYNTHHSMRHRWSTFKVSADDSPRVSDEYVEEVAATYGRNSNVFRVRVLGEFPTADDNAVVPMDWVESAIGRAVARHGDICWGLDVARFGDDRTALCKRSQNTLLEPIRWWSSCDLMETCGRVVAEFDGTPKDDQPSAIYVDTIGLGAGVVDRLRERGLPVVGVNVAEAPSHREQFMRLRDELWWALREWFEARDCRLVKDEDLAAELTMPLYKMTSSGKIVVETKDDMKKRGIRSPDLADSLMLTFYHRFTDIRRTYARSYRRGAKQKHPAQSLDWVV